MGRKEYNIEQRWYKKRSSLPQNILRIDIMSSRTCFNKCFSVDNKDKPNVACLDMYDELPVKEKYM
jgi:hypothetical protein